MRASRYLVSSLVRAALDIETGKREYDWTDTACCNVGVLAQVILQTDKRGLETSFLAGDTLEYSTWTIAAAVSFNDYKTLGKHTSRTIELLSSFGLDSEEDFFNIQYLGSSPGDYEDLSISYSLDSVLYIKGCHMSQNAITYFRQEAQRLEMQLQTKHLL